jgi:hypothetical protein
MAGDEAWPLGYLLGHRACGGDHGHVVCFDVQEEAKCGTGHALTVGAVAGVAEERGGEETVANGVADAAAGYGWERLVFGFWDGILIWGRRWRSC